MLLEVIDPITPEFGYKTKNDFWRESKTNQEEVDQTDQQHDKIDICQQTGIHGLIYMHACMQALERPNGKERQPPAYIHSWPDQACCLNILCMI